MKFRYYGQLKILKIKLSVVFKSTSKNALVESFDNRKPDFLIPKSFFVFFPLICRRFGGDFRGYERYGRYTYIRILMIQFGSVPHHICAKI